MLRAPDPERTSSGLKQSLDSTRLCGAGTRGVFFLRLCKPFDADNWHILLQQLKVLRQHIGDTSVRVNFAIPAIWARGKTGVQIQRVFREHTIRAGFSEETLGFDTEPGAIAAYRAWANKKLASRNVCGRKIVACDEDYADATLG